MFLCLSNYTTTKAWVCNNKRSCYLQSQLTFRSTCQYEGLQKHFQRIHTSKSCGFCEHCICLWSFSRWETSFSPPQELHPLSSSILLTKLSVTFLTSLSQEGSMTIVVPIIVYRTLKCNIHIRRLVCYLYSYNT